MRPSLLASLVVPLILSLACAGPPSARADGLSVDGLANLSEASFDIVPRPVSIELVPESFAEYVLQPGAFVSFRAEPTGAVAHEAQRLAEWLQRATGWDVPLRPDSLAPGALYLSLKPELEPALGTEGYRITSIAETLRLSAGSGAGLFYAIQTLRQMLPVELETPAAERKADFAGCVFPGFRLVDQPRFRWRGVMLDVGRYLYDVDEIERLLERMAAAKMNVFHWHLTEDQGWRIEIERYPLLTEVGAWRKSTPVRGDRSKPDGVPYGGFYTQDQIREVVAFAADLHIDVMPEIELPGHSTAAIAAYNELGNPEFSAGLEVGSRWGVHPNTLAPTEATLRFYEGVFDEVLALFPFEFVHIGGDEAPKGQWRDSPTAQARKRELGLETEDQLQAWFVAHFERYLAARGRRLVGWDEIHEGGLPTGATMMVWRGWDHGIEAAREGHDLIMAPTSYTYLDYYQGPAAGEPEAIGGLLPLEKVYAFEPLPPELTAEEAGHVLGAQGQLWSEYLPDWPAVEYMAFPRLFALAEVVWSPREARDWDDFRRRLAPQLARLDALGVGYRQPPPAPELDAVLFESAFDFVAPAGSMWIYTTDGSVPTAASPRLAAPLHLTATTQLRVASLRAGGHVSSPVTIPFVLTDEAGSPKVPAADLLLPGLWKQTAPGGRRELPADTAFAGATRVPVTQAGIQSESGAAVRYSGFLEVETAGLYTLTLGSDDGSRIELAGQTFVENGGSHAHLEKSAKVQLPAGTWPFTLRYFDAGGAHSLSLSIDGPGAWRFLRERP